MSLELEGSAATAVSMETSERGGQLTAAREADRQLRIARLRRRCFWLQGLQLASALILTVAVGFILPSITYGFLPLITCVGVLVGVLHLRKRLHALIALTREMLTAETGVAVDKTSVTWLIVMACVCILAVLCLATTVIATLGELEPH